MARAMMSRALRAMRMMDLAGRFRFRGGGAAGRCMMAADTGAGLVSFRVCRLGAPSLDMSGCILVAYAVLRQERSAGLVSDRSGVNQVMVASRLEARTKALMKAQS